MSTYFSTSPARIAFVLLGGLGTLLCLAGIAGVWWLEARLNHVRQQLATAAAVALSGFEDKLSSARIVVADATLTVDDVEQRLGRWTRQELADRASERLELESRLDQLTDAADQTQRVLGSSQEALDATQRILTVAGEVGLPVTGEMAGNLATTLATLRIDVDAAGVLLVDMRQQLGGDQPDEGHLAHATQLLARLVATFGNIDDRLKVAIASISTLEQSVTHIAIRSRWKLLVAATLATLLLLWMATGQVSLLRRGLQK